MHSAEFTRTLAYSKFLHLATTYRERPMEYDDYVRFLRTGLISATGMAESEALLYAGKSARSGAASEAARSGMEPPPNSSSRRCAGHQLAPHLQAGKHGGQEARLLGAGALDTA